MERVLSAVCHYINNYFEYGDAHEGTFSVINGTLVCSFLQDNQYFRIKGSIFNDGVHKYPVTGLSDETFTGVIHPMAIPQDFLDLVDEIGAYIDNEANAPTGYTSESFGGYSYTRATNDNGAAVTWQDVFRSRLNRYRKVW